MSIIKLTDRIIGLQKEGKRGGTTIAPFLNAREGRGKERRQKKSTFLHLFQGRRKKGRKGRTFSMKHLTAAP